MADVSGAVVFGLLGPVQVVEPGGRETLREPRCRAVLAALLLEAGHTLPVPRLATLVWGHDAPPSARKAIQVYVSRLRAHLADVPGADLVTEPDGYRLRCDPESVDVNVFRGLVRQARRHGNPQRRAELFRQALGLWRGAACADTGPGGLRDWVAPMIEEERIAALEQLYEARLAGGEHDEVLGPLSALAGEHPLRERITGLLMVAQHRCGQTATAASTFRTLRRRMIRETGLEPGPAVAALHRQILTGMSDPFAQLFPGSVGHLLDRADSLLLDGDRDRALALYHAARALAHDSGDTAASTRATLALRSAGTAPSLPSASAGTSL